MMTLAALTLASYPLFITVFLRTNLHKIRWIFFPHLITQTMYIQITLHNLSSEILIILSLPFTFLCLFSLLLRMFFFFFIKSTRKWIYTKTDLTITRRQFHWDTVVYWRLNITFKLCNYIKLIPICFTTDNYLLCSFSSLSWRPFSRDT